MKKILGILLILTLLVFSGCTFYSKEAKKEVQEKNITPNITNISEAEAVEEVEKIFENLSEEFEIPVEEKNETEQEEKIKVIKVKETDFVKLNPIAYDLDQDKLTFTFSPPLNASGEWQTNYGDAGTYNITITASDGKTTTKAYVELIVEKVNVPPIIKAPTNITVFETEAVEIVVNASDPNKDPVNVSINSSLFEKHDNVFVWQTNFKDNGEYTFKVTATDGELTSEKKINVRVKKKNVPPIIQELKDITVKEGEEVVIAVNVTDPNGDEFNLTINNDNFVKEGNVFKWKTDYVSHGVYNITITATDTEGASSSQGFVLTVKDVNMPPVIKDIVLVKE